MAKALLILVTTAIREKAAKWVSAAPPGTRLTFEAPRRTLPQNAKMWSMLTDIAHQKMHAGRKFTTEEWKIVFMHAVGRETQFVPSLDGTTFIPFGQSSRDLSVEEMSDLIELMTSWGVENGITFTDKSPEAERVLNELRQRRPRVKDEKYLTFIRQQPCCLCGDNVTVEAAHIRLGSPKHNKLYTGKGEKPDDIWAIPLCGKHHRDQHTTSEPKFWAQQGKNPFEIAQAYQSQHQTEKAA